MCATRLGPRRLARSEHSHPALQDAIDDVFNARIGDVSGRGKLAADMREIWMMQPRFDKRVGSTPWGLVDQPRFRAGFDFMRLRADVGEVDVVLADWWQEFSTASDAQREDLIDQVRDEQGSRGPRRVRTVKPAVAAPDAPGQAIQGASSGGDPAENTSASVDAPRKRRRRRRKPGGEGGGAAAVPGDDSGA
jgi:poly(A) polymerase